MPKKVDVDIIKAKILEDSFKVFARNGYSNVSIRKLASELGCTTGTLYHYFESKEVIFSEMIMKMAEQDIREGIAEINLGTNLIEKGTRLFMFVESRKDYFKDLLFISMDCIRQEEFEKEKAVIRDGIAAYRRNIVEQLELQSPELGVLILSTLVGLIFQTELDPKNVSFSSALDSLLGELS